jgi:hypothetical protein
MNAQSVEVYSMKNAKIYSSTDMIAATFFQHATDAELSINSRKESE